MTIGSYPHMIHEILKVPGNWRILLAGGQGAQSETPLFQQSTLDSPGEDTGVGCHFFL